MWPLVEREEVYLPAYIWVRWLTQRTRHLMGKFSFWVVWGGIFFFAFGTRDWRRTHGQSERVGRLQDGEVITDPFAALWQGVRLPAGPSHEVCEVLWSRRCGLFQSITDKIGQDPQYIPVPLRGPETEAGAEGPVIRNATWVGAEHRCQVSLCPTPHFLWTHSLRNKLKDVTKDVTLYNPVAAE